MYIENKLIKKQLSIWMLFMFFLVSLIIIIGGLTRLTDSGLSITEWELFKGFIPPLNHEQMKLYFELYKQIPEYKLQNFSMNLSEFKVIFWWEWSHRFIARIIGILYLIPLIYFTYILGFKKVKYLYFIFFLICFQGFIGWFMVSSGLTNRVDVSHFRLSIHLLFAFLILSLLLFNYLNFRVEKNISIKLNPFLPLSFLILIFFQIIIGAFVSGMDAGKIYNSWPLMGSSYFPDDNNFEDLFKFSAFSDPSLVQFIHRNLAYVISIFYLSLLIIIYKKKMNNLYKTINILGFILVLQIFLGILTVIYGAQIYIASVHQISSIFLVSICIYFYYINTRSNLQLSN